MENVSNCKNDATDGGDNGEEAGRSLCLYYQFAFCSSNGRHGYSKGQTLLAFKEREKDYKMRFDMLGMTRDDVNVWVEENMLVVKAEKAPKRNQQGQTESRKENADEEWPAKSYGRYSCRISLQGNIEFKKINAEVKDRVMYTTIPKLSTTRKVIGINVQ